MTKNLNLIEENIRFREYLPRILTFARNINQRCYISRLYNPSLEARKRSIEAKK